MNGVVYALGDPRDHSIRYVGATKNAPGKRLRQHITAGRRGERLPVAKWVGSLLRDDIEPFMIIITRWPDLDRDAYDIEVEVIERFKSYGHRLLNVTPGGRGGGIGPKSLEHRAKISAALKGRLLTPPTPESRAAHSARMTGRKHSAETREKISQANQRRRELILVSKTCLCGTEFKVIPSRVDRIKYCGEACPAKGATP